MHRRNARSRKARRPAGLGVLLAFVGMLLLILAFTLLRSISSPHQLSSATLTLQVGEVSGYRLLVNTVAGPTQRTPHPLPYQQQFLNGNLRYYMADTVLTQKSLSEIESWAKLHNVPVTNPPTIVGPYVLDHSGVFAITSEGLLYADTKSAIADFHCCTYVDRQASFAQYHEIPVHLGDEATAFGGILDSPAHDPHYEVQLYAIRWRQGTVVSVVSIIGAHDVVFLRPPSCRDTSEEYCQRIRVLRVFKENRS